MPAIKTDLASGRDLKVGSVYIPSGETNVFCKITGVTTSKPGKHGSAKNIITAKNILNGKFITTTFKDTDEKVLQVLDFNYMYKVVYSLTDGEILVSLETGETIPLLRFGSTYAPAVTKTIQDEIAKVGNNLTNASGEPLLIKYSEVDETGTNLVFWEVLYAAEADLPRYGITDYTPN